MVPEAAANVFSAATGQGAGSGLDVWRLTSVLVLISLLLSFQLITLDQGITLLSSSTRRAACAGIEVGRAAVSKFCIKETVTEIDYQC